MTLVLALTVAVLYGVGAYLLMQRNLSRIVIGLGVLGHGANLLLLMAGGRAGQAPIVGEGGPGGYADPLPQALALTAIVITFGVSAYLLVLVYRSWVLNQSDEVEDDVEDRRIAEMSSNVSDATGGEE
ncbi:MAG: NADH-quinone oxidoreductase subunit K [Acidimicrobiia bacterium]|nr:NADH-quinone oxidoreductase subunit K [Acidimicrobiia bacterium]